MADNNDFATLQYPGGETKLDIVRATEGADGFALGKLLADTGYTTFDAGFVNTASTKSAITYIDGDAGILRYRGYPIEQLADKSTFIEVSYLLIYGELPTPQQLEDFTTKIQRHTLLHEDLKRFFDGFPRNAHPMPVLSSAANALSAYYQDSLDPHDDAQVELSTIRLLAKLPTIAAYAYKKSVGQPFLYPDNTLTLVENFLRMTFGLPAEPYEVDRRSCGPWTCCSSCMPTTSRTAPPRRCVWSAPRTPTCSPPCPAASTRCGARCTAVPIRRCWRCSSASARRAAIPTTSCAG
ncbi:citrate synthase 1 [Mycobacteroides abscessus subsp. bolletii 1513]|uniref:Citrate synthase 1 n=1 Tax=Mycobacteroides abscessus subsp. bolletii 1513 TaxID=1299321 RepID=X8E358_9MYCO|nr:citrate synthase 1 [Mycobacteroides abscessus subsp. bolletii 1513]